MDGAQTGGHWLTAPDGAFPAGPVDGGVGTLGQAAPQGDGRPAPLMASFWTRACRPTAFLAAVATAAAARRQEVVVYLPCGAGPGARQRLEAELDPSRGSGSARVAVGSPGDVADTLRAFAAAGATTVVLQPAGDEPNIDSILRLAAEARIIIRDVPA